MDKEECVALYSEPETEEHIKGKRILFEWIKEQPEIENVVLEGWIPETKQRPDIIFEHRDRKFVIEFQCSPISTEYEERHALYKAAGIKDIWICGVQKYFQEFHKGSGVKRLNHLEEQCKTYFDPNTYKIFKIHAKIQHKDSDVDSRVDFYRKNFLNLYRVKDYSIDYKRESDLNYSYTKKKFYSTYVNYHYVENRSIAAYFDIRDLIIKKITRGAGNLVMAWKDEVINGS